MLAWAVARHGMWFWNGLHGDRVINRGLPDAPPAIAVALGCSSQLGLWQWLFRQSTKQPSALTSAPCVHAGHAVSERTLRDKAFENVPRCMRWTREESAPGGYPRMSAGWAYSHWL